MEDKKIMEKTRIKEIEDRGRVKRKGKADKGTAPYASSFGYFFGSIVKSNGRINRGKGASA